MTPITDAFTQGGQHENRIRAIFPNSFVWQGDFPIFSKPLYILAFANRSGSNLLADYLRQTGNFRGFGESLNWDQVQRSQAARPVASFADYIAELIGLQKKPGFWGVKASWDQIIMLRRARVTSMFSGVQVIHSVRQNVVDQAISHWIAHQTNQWTSLHEKNDVAVDFSLSSIEQIIMDITRSNAYIDQVTQAFGMPRHVVVYERLQNEPELEIKRLADAVSFDLGDWQPRAPRISRQRNEVNDDFRRRCLEAWRSAVSTLEII